MTRPGRGRPAIHDADAAARGCVCSSDRARFHRGPPPRLWTSSTRPPHQSNASGPALSFAIAMQCTSTRQPGPGRGCPAQRRERTQAAPEYSGMEWRGVAACAGGAKAAAFRAARACLLPGGRLPSGKRRNESAQAAGPAPVPATVIVVATSSAARA